MKKKIIFTLRNITVKTVKYGCLHSKIENDRYLFHSVESLVIHSQVERTNGKSLLELDVPKAISLQSLYSVSENFSDFILLCWVM